VKRRERMESLIEYMKSIAKPSAKALHYPGADTRIVSDIITMLDKAPCSRCTLVEVFGGSGVVSQRVPREKFFNVIYNDKDEIITHLIRIIKEKPQELEAVLSLIPYSREVWEYVRERFIKTGLRDIEDPILKAVYIFYLVNGSRNGMLADTKHMSFSCSTTTNVARKFLSHIAAIEDVAKRFRDVTIECLDFTEAIKRYDSPITVFYLDPPYVGRDDFYRLPFTSLQARTLVRLLNAAKGYWLLKIHEDQLRYYSGLRYESKVELEATKWMEVLEQGEKRETFRYVFLANYEITGNTSKQGALDMFLG